MLSQCIVFAYMIGGDINCLHKWYYNG